MNILRPVMSIQSYPNKKGHSFEHPLLISIGLIYFFLNELIALIVKSERTSVPLIPARSDNN